MSDCGYCGAPNDRGRYMGGSCGTCRELRQHRDELLDKNAELEAVIANHKGFVFKKGRSVIIDKDTGEVTYKNE